MNGQQLMKLPLINSDDKLFLYKQYWRDILFMASQGSYTGVICTLTKHHDTACYTQQFKCSKIFNIIRLFTTAFSNELCSNTERLIFYHK